MKAIVISKMKRNNPQKRAVLKYVSNWIAHPDKQSSFYRKVHFISWLPKPLLIGLMKKMRYDGILFEKEGNFIANIFFQRHGAALHMFAIAVDPEFQKKGIAKKCVRDFINYARSVGGIKQIRIGAGNDQIVTKLHEGLKKDATILGIKVLEKGWVELIPE